MDCDAILVDGVRLGMGGGRLHLEGYGWLNLSTHTEHPMSVKFHVKSIFHSKISKISLFANHRQSSFRLRLTLLPLTIIDAYLCAELDESVINAWMAALRQFQRESLINGCSQGTIRTSVDRLNQDYARMGVDGTAWRISDANLEYSIIAVPSTISDSILKHAAKFRVRNRLPVLSFLASGSVAICRSGQPLVGMQRRRSAQDERLLLEIARSTGASELLIVDARPGLNAVVNTLTGAGFEPLDRYPGSQRIFVNIPNIHAVRRAFLDIFVNHKARVRRARRVFESPKSPVEGEPINTSLADGWKEWAGMVEAILEGTRRIVHSVHREGVPVLVHCSDGWDRTAQLCSLAQICLDPHYRTLPGLISLIEREWVEFGHRFDDRLGLKDQALMGARDIIESHEQWAPIFPQFIECIGILMTEFPEAFAEGINQQHLREIVQASCSKRFFFQANSDRERLCKDYAGELLDYLLPENKTFLSKFSGVLEIPKDLSVKPESISKSSVLHYNYP